MSQKQATNEQTVKFNAKPYIRQGLTESDIIDIKSYFDLFDKENCGSINAKQLKNAFASLGQEAKSQPIYQVILDMDSEGNGNINFEQFIHLMTPKLLKNDTSQNIDRIFTLFDSQKTGFISVKDLRRAVKELHLAFSEEDLQDMIKRVGQDSDGFVSGEEFFNLISRFGV